MPHWRSAPALAAWAAAHAASRAHPCGLFGPRHLSSSRPASSRATAACTLLCASTPTVIMGRPFLDLCSLQRRSPVDRALLGHQGPGSYQVTPAEQRAGTTGRGQGTRPPTAWVSPPRGALSSL